MRYVGHEMVGAVDNLIGDGEESTGEVTRAGHETVFTGGSSEQCQVSRTLSVFD